MAISVVHKLSISVSSLRVPVIETATWSSLAFHFWRTVEDGASGVEFEIVVVVYSTGVGGDKDFDAIIARDGVVALVVFGGNVGVERRKTDIEIVIVPQQACLGAVFGPSGPPGETELIDDGCLCPCGFVEAAVDGDGRSGVGDSALGQVLRAGANRQE